MDVVFFPIEIKYAPGGDENYNTAPAKERIYRSIEIKYAPGGDENKHTHFYIYSKYTLRLNMPREGTKTLNSVIYFYGEAFIEIKYAPGGDEN